MPNHIKWTIFLLLLVVFAGCRDEDEGKLKFEMLESEKTVKLSNEDLSPLCSVSLKMACATESSCEIGKKINNEVVYRIFNQDGVGMQ